MCRNIKTLFNFDPPVTDDEVRAASLQFVRKITGFNKPSKSNEALFLAAVDDVAAIPLAELGPQLEHDRFFPERANIGVAALVGEDKLRLRVWERGAGLTLACGSGACAALVAANRRGLVKRHAEVIVDGGTLGIEWLRDDHVMMTGGIALAFKGELDPSLLA